MQKDFQNSYYNDSSFEIRKAHCKHEELDYALENIFIDKNAILICLTLFCHCNKIASYNKHLLFAICFKDA